MSNLKRLEELLLCIRGILEKRSKCETAPATEWQDISTAPTGDDDFYLVCCNDPADDRSPFVVRGSIFASARRSNTPAHLSLGYLTHWMPLPAKPIAVLADDRGNET